MRGFFKWLVVALSWSSGLAAETKAPGENSDPDYQQFMTLAPTTPKPPTVTEMNLDFADRLLKQIQYELASTMNASSDLQELVRRYDFKLNTIKVEKTRLVAVMAPRRADLLSKKQKLAQARAKLEHSWLLLERCPNYERLDGYVRQSAQRLADERAVAELAPMARKRYLLRYLRLLKSLERRAARENLSSNPHHQHVPRGE